MPMRVRSAGAREALMATLIRGHLLLVAVACCACSHSPRVAEITVTHIADIDSWKVEYVLPEFVDELVFVRHETLYRAASWRIASGNVELRVEGEYEVLRSDNAEPFDRFSIIAPSSFESLQRDYSQNHLFSDGSSLLFTGHFVVADSNLNPLNYSLRLVPSESERIVVRGNQVEGGVAIDSAGEDGLFAYFGTLPPVEGRNFIAVLDPALPDWLVTFLSEFLPELLDYYAENLGDALVARPSIYFNYTDTDSEDAQFAGSALLDGTYQLSASGRAWFNPNSGLHAVIPALIAHESAHLWNGHVIATSGAQGGSWMHEGGADTLAWRALRELGYLSTDEFSEKVGQAYRHCAEGLAGRPLHSLTTASQQGLQYSCGAVIGRATELALHQSGSDLFAFWRRLIERAIAAEVFSEQEYLDLLHEMTRNQELVAAIEGLAFATHSDSKVQLKELFDSVKTAAPKLN